ncbi:hypothetical protein GGF44_002527, partial [Coemansia sp. RSA 1694]
MRRNPNERENDNASDALQPRNEGLERGRRTPVRGFRSMGLYGDHESDEGTDQDDNSQDEDRDIHLTMIRNGFEAADDDDDDDGSDDSDDSDDDDDDDRNMVNILENDDEFGVHFGGAGHMFSSGEEHSDDGESDNTDEEYMNANHIALSHENLPSLVRGAINRAHDRAKKSHHGNNSDHSPRQQFIPKYLEKTAYGALHNHLVGKCGKAGGSGNDSTAGGAGVKAVGRQSSNGTAEHGPATGLVAPDLFFRTLAQDTWPHYCSSVPAVPAIAGLRLGYGLGLGDRLGLDASQGGDSGAGASQFRSSGAARGSQISGSTSLAARRVATSGADVQEQPTQRPGDRRSQQNAEALAKQRQRLPSAWLAVKNLVNMTVDSDRVSIRYTGPGRQDQDAAMVRSNYSIPTHTGVYYFEVLIKSRGQSGYIGVGLSQGHVSVHRLPGWDAGSWGYHGDDGNSFDGDGRGSKYGPGFTTGDTVGCGIDFMKRRVFFTRNGFFLGYAFGSIDTTKDLFPCVGMRTLGEHVRANFGRRPFVFDISHYVSVAHEDALRLVSSTSICPLLPAKPGAKPSAKDDAKDDAKGKTDAKDKPDASAADLLSATELLQLRDSELGVAAPGRSAGMDESGAALGIVLSYLLHNECFSTARALIENVIGRQQSAGAEEPATGGSSNSARLTAIYSALSEQDAQRETRRRICRHISQGDIDYALGLLQDSYPAVLENESLVFQLRCRQFIELVRASKGCHIADCVPSDDSQLAVPVAPRAPAVPATSGPRVAEDMMDVDDTCSASMMSLAAITNAPNSLHRARFGQIASLRKMEAAQLVRVMLEYGRQLQADYGASPNPIIREGLVHTFSLLAYADAAQSPVAALLDPAACEPLARLVDAAIVATENPPRMSALECICRHAGALLAELSSRRNGAASLLSIERDFMRVP